MYLRFGIFFVLIIKVRDFMSWSLEGHSIFEVKYLLQRNSLWNVPILQWGNGFGKFTNRCRKIPRPHADLEKIFDPMFSTDRDFWENKNMSLEFQSFLGVTHILTGCGIIRHELLIPAESSGTPSLTLYWCTHCLATGSNKQPIENEEEGKTLLLAKKLVNSYSSFTELWIALWLFKTKECSSSIFQRD